MMVHNPKDNDMKYNENRTPRSQYEHPDGWDPGIPAKKAVSYSVEQRVYACLVLNGGQIVDEKGYATSKLQRLMAGPKRSRETVTRACNQLEAKGWVIIDKRGNARKTYGVYVMDAERHAAKWALDELRTLIIERKSKANAKPVVAPPDYEAKSPVLRDIEAQNAIIREQQAAEAAKVQDTGTAVEAAVVTIEEEVPAPLDTPPAIEEPAAEVFRTVTHDADPADIADALFLKVMSVITEGPKVEVIEKRVEVPREDSETMTAIKKERSELRQRVKSLETALQEAKNYAYNVEQDLSAKKAQMEQMDRNIEALVKQVSILTDQLEVFKSRERRQGPKRPPAKKPASPRGTALTNRLSPEEQAALEALKRIGTDK
jgi:hypothetical protein